MPTLKLKKIVHVEYIVSSHDLSAFIEEVTGRKVSIYLLLSDELRFSYYPDRKYVVSPTPNFEWNGLCLHNEPACNIQNILNGLCVDNFIEPGNYTIRLY